MTAYKGESLLIKIGDGESSEQFTTLGGLRTSKITLSRSPLVANNRESGAWQSLQSAAGIQSLTVSATGLFTDSVTEETLRALAFSGANRNFQLLFPNGDTATGAFQVSAYERSGNHDAEELYSLTIRSAGAITFAAG